MIRGAYQQVNNLIVQFTTARGAAQRVFEMLDALPDVDLNAGIKLRREDVQGTFELSNIEFAYQMRPKEKVIDGINLTIRGGSTVAFVGKSGGGKSTMIHLLMRFVRTPPLPPAAATAAPAHPSTTHLIECCGEKCSTIRRVAQSSWTVAISKRSICGRCMS